MQASQVPPHKNGQTISVLTWLCAQKHFHFTELLPQSWKQTHKLNVHCMLSYEDLPSFEIKGTDANSSRQTGN